MKKTGIFYGSTTGTTQQVANQIANLLDMNSADVHDVAKVAPTDVADYEVLILGTSTWRSGDLQDDWEDFVNGLKVLDLTGKQIALFGCGDETMSDTFCDGVGTLYDDLQDTGAEFIGQFKADGYDFQHSKAIRNGVAVGLLIDEVNEPQMTPERLDEWCTIIKNTIAD